MKKLLGIGFLATFLITGCTANSIIKPNGFYDEVSGKWFTQQLTTVRDRTGTEMQYLLTLDEHGNKVDSATVGGRGIVAGATDGTGSALLQGTGFATGMSLFKSGNTNVSNGNVGNNQQSQGMEQFQGQGQLQTNTFKPTNSFNPTNVNLNNNTFKPVNSFNPTNAVNNSFKNNIHNNIHNK